MISRETAGVVLFDVDVEVEDLSPHQCMADWLSL